METIKYRVGQELLQHKWLGIMFMIVNVLDMVSTYAAVTTGAGAEGGPILMYMSLSAGSVYKLGLAGLVVVLLALWRRMYMLKWLSILLGLIVLWNVMWTLVGAYA